MRTLHENHDVENDRAALPHSNTRQLVEQLGRCRTMLEAHARGIELNVNRIETLHRTLFAMGVQS